MSRRFLKPDERGKMLNGEQRKTLLKLARNTIETYTAKSIINRFETDDPALKQLAGAFVTIHKNGKLRGCIGMIDAREPLYETVIEMSIQASRNDPRFEPVNEYELKDIDVEISVLYPPVRVKSIDDIELGKHGVIVKKGFASGVFLPQVARETGWSKTEFLEHLCNGKAGLPKDAYLDPKTEIYTFEAEVFGEKDIGKE